MRDNFAHLMPDYSFITQWWLDAPIDAVWKAIQESERWPDWWKSVADVRVISSGDERGVGAIRRFTWRGRLPYTLTFDMRVTKIEPPILLEGIASGDLAGEGRWRLAPEDSGTAVRYDWKVRANKVWMRLFAPILRPVFSWNHDAVMKNGEIGLRRLLGIR